MPLLREPERVELGIPEPMAPLEEAMAAAAPSPASWEPQRETRRIYTSPREVVGPSRHVHNIGPVFITFEKQPREAWTWTGGSRASGPE